MRYLDEHNYGYPTAAGKVPIVPAAILYDLNVGDGKIRPNAEAGYKACANAKAGPVDEGSVGAGAGAKGSTFDTLLAVYQGISVTSLIPVAQDDDSGGFFTSLVRFNVLAGQSYEVAIDGFAGVGGDIVLELGVEATTDRLPEIIGQPSGRTVRPGVDVTFSVTARAINPTHTPSDGDTLFALSTGTSTINTNHGAIGALAAEAVSEAILRAVMKAKSVAGIPSYQDLR